MIKTSISNIISTVLHPMIVMALTIILMSILVQNNILLSFAYTGILTTCLMPGIICYSVNKWQPHHQRGNSVELALLVIGLAATLGIYKAMHAPDMLIRGLMAGSIGGFGATIINRLWDISFHAATSAGCAALLLAISWPLAIVMAVLSIMVGLARLPTKHHTLAQVIGGWMYGFTVTVALVSL